MANRDDSPPPYGIHFKADGSVAAAANFAAGDFHPYTLQLIQAMSRIGVFDRSISEEKPKDTDAKPAQASSSSGSKGGATDAAQAEEKQEEKTEKTRSKKGKKKQAKAQKKNHRSGKK